MSFKEYGNKEYGNKEYGCGGLSCRFCKENYYSGTKNCFDMNQNMELPKEHFHITFSDFFKMLIDPNISKKAKKKDYRTTFHIL
jgi:hypothetical protein